MNDAPFTIQNKRRFLNAGMKIFIAVMCGWAALLVPRFMASQVLGWPLYLVSTAPLLLMLLFLWLAVLSLRATHQPGSHAT